MLTVTLKSKIDLDINQIIIYLDRTGISRLIDILESLQTLGGRAHLKTQALGGDELDQEGLEFGGVLVNHLHIEMKPD